MPGFSPLEGVLAEPRQLPVTVSSPGVHRVIVSFSTSRQATRDTLFLVGNRPSGFSLALSVPLERQPDDFVYYDNSVFISFGNVIEKRSAVDLTLLTSLEIENEGVGPSAEIRGLSISDEGLLYALNGPFSEVIELDLLSLTPLRAFDVAEISNHFVDASLPGHLYTGGPAGVSITTLSTEILAERRFSTGRYFAIGPSARKVAFAVGGPSPALLLLDGLSLSTIWTVPLPLSPQITAFSFDDSVVYAIGVSDNDLHFLAISSSGGEVLHHIILEPCPSCFNSVERASVAHLDGYTLFTTSIGTYFVDPALHLPTLRTERFFESVCCQLAIAEVPPTLFFLNATGSFLSTLILGEQ